MKYLLLLNLICPLLIYAQCNGSIALCNKRYNEVAYLTTHNAFNCADNTYLFPNQTGSITQQLNDGVRAFMLDVYDFFGSTVLYHGTIVTGSEPLTDVLTEIKNYMDAHPNEVITLIFESYVGSSAIESALQSTGLLTMAYAKLPSNPWPTLQEMIDQNKRLFILTDVNDATSAQPWYHYAWDLAVETNFSVNDVNSFSNDFNRGDSINELFIFNHFVTDATLGIGSTTASATANEYTFLKNRILSNYAAKNKFQNYITLDFYDLGNGLEVVDWLNNGSLELKESSENPQFLLYPNPANGLCILQLSNYFSGTITVTDASGKIYFDSPFSGENFILPLELKQGIYFVRLANSSHAHTEKLIVH
jgi:hypothetical protein